MPVKTMPLNTMTIKIGLAQQLYYIAPLGQAQQVHYIAWLGQAPFYAD